MRSTFSKLAQAAGIALALALTLSCSSDDGGNIVYGPSVPYEGKTYKTVKIGSQVWMTENLNYDVSGTKLRLRQGDVLRRRACPQEHLRQGLLV